MRSWPLAALLLLLAAAMPQPASAAEQEGVRLLFPDPAWVDGEAMLAEIQGRLHGTVALAMHFDDFAALDEVRAVDHAVVHEIARTDGSKDEYRIPISAHGYRVLDLSRMDSFLVVRQREAAMQAYLPSEKLPDGVVTIQPTGSTLPKVIQESAHSVALGFSLPTRGPRRGAFRGGNPAISRCTCPTVISRPTPTPNMGRTGRPSRMAAWGVVGKRRIPPTRATIWPTILPGSLSLWTCRTS